MNRNWNENWNTMINGNGEMNRNWNGNLEFNFKLFIEKSTVKKLLQFKIGE